MGFRALSLKTHPGAQPCVLTSVIAPGVESQLGGKVEEAQQVSLPAAGLVASPGTHTQGSHLGRTHLHC